MGLDMYAFRVSNGADLPVVDANLGDATTELIAQWRKHPNLHGWMEALYVEKGGKSQSFNCDTVEVTSADLDALEQIVNGNNLPETSGFFFGVSQPEDKADDLAFIAAAREAIAAGDRVYYDSWW